MNLDVRRRQRLLDDVGDVAIAGVLRRHHFQRSQHGFALRLQRAPPEQARLARSDRQQHLQSLRPCSTVPSARMAITRTSSSCATSNATSSSDGMIEGGHSSSVTCSACRSTRESRSAERGPKCVGAAPCPSQGHSQGFAPHARVVVLQKPHRIEVVRQFVELREEGEQVATGVPTRVGDETRTASRAMSGPAWRSQSNADRRT